MNRTALTVVLVILLLASLLTTAVLNDGAVVSLVTAI